MKYFYTIVLSLICFNTALAQKLKFAYDVDLHAFFDNREYKSEFQQSQTVFGSRIAPDLGVQFLGNNYIMAGINYLQEFGHKSFDSRPEYTLYYRYTNDWFNGIGGSFNRRFLKGDYPFSMFSDLVPYYDPNIDGCLFQFHNKKAWFEFFCDWFGRQDENVREKFMLATSAEYRHKMFFAGYNFYMIHYAGTTAADSLIDNGVAYPYAGVDFTPIVPAMKKLYIKGGLMCGLEQVRATGEGFRATPGFQIELEAQWKMIGLKNTFRTGKGMMVNWGKFDDEYNTLYWGDPYYRAKNYNRLDLYWQIAKTKYVDFKLQSVFHSDGKVLADWQQMLTLRVNINNL
ncbi:MAG: hypothetical protein ACRCZQ_02850 [Bacteroidales bacterium]